MWLPEDTEAALVWQEAQDDRCECGQPRSESFDPNGPEYVASPLRCRACQVRESTASRWQRDEHADTHGLKFAVIAEGGDDG